MKVYDFHVYLLSYQNELAAARLKEGTAQSFKVGNLARIFMNLSWYDTIFLHSTISVINRFPKE